MWATIILQIERNYIQVAEFASIDAISRNSFVFPVNGSHTLATQLQPYLLPSIFSYTVSTSIQLVTALPSSVQRICLPLSFTLCFCLPSTKDITIVTAVSSLSRVVRQT